MIDFTEIEFHKDDLEELMKLEIDFAFQPIFRASDMSIGAYEALMRPKGQSPLELIEAYQKLNKLFVIELATCFGATLEFKKRGYTNTLCINSFPSEFMNEGQSRLYGRYFPELVGKVIVEIVEYTKLDRDKWISKKEDIDRHSTRIALDDFSTGQNNMEALEYFQPQYAKLDRSLICNIHNDSDKQEKVSSLIREFHSRGVKVVAEGIETKEELDYLKAYTKVDYFQGYYLGYAYIIIYMQRNMQNVSILRGRLSVKRYTLFFYKFRRFLYFTPKTPYFTPSHQEFIAKIRYNKRMGMYIQKSAKGRRSL